MPLKLLAQLSARNLFRHKRRNLMLLIAIVTLSRHRLQERGGRWLKLVSGVVMLALGVVILIEPGLLYWGT